MSTQVTAWKDNDGQLHESKEKAEEANKTIIRNRLRVDVTIIINNALRANNPSHEMHGIFDIEYLEGLNHQYLQPLADYIFLLIEESKERTEKYGQ